MLPFDLEAIVFDVGGTLLRLDYVFIAELATECGSPLDPGALARGEVASRRAIDAEAGSGGVRGTDATRREVYFRRMLETAGAPGAIAARVAADMESAHRERNLWRVPLEGAEATLAGLRDRGLRTAVVSNADGRIEQGLAAHGLNRHLDVIVDSHYEGVEKPDPEIFQRALERLGVAPRRAAYIGDIYSIDALGARGVGLVPVIVDPTGEYAGLDCLTIAALGELLAHVVPRDAGRDAEGEA